MSAIHSLFVSFSAQDNAKTGNSPGWIDDFIRYLGVYMQRINKQSPKIIALTGSDKAPALLEASDGMILIVSANYIKENLANRDAPLLSDPSRIFKNHFQIYFIPVPSVQRPSGFDRLLTGHHRPNPFRT